MSMINKVMMDKLELSEKVSYRKSKVTIYVEGTDTVLFEDSNKVNISGAILTACKHWNIKSPLTLPNYNTELGITADGLDLSSSVDERDKSIVLFCMGIGGCGPEATQVFPVNFASWIKPNELIPFQYRHKNNDLAPDERNVYFGRKVIGDYVAYYYKAFDTEPKLKYQHIDGAPINSNIYETDNTTPVEVFVETKMKVTKEDMKEYFERTVGLNEARLSSISLLTGLPVTSADGYVYYKDIQPLTKYNFSVENLSDLAKGLDITYQLYY